jgi:hypothetical protein
MVEAMRIRMRADRAGAAAGIENGRIVCRVEMVASSSTTRMVPNR